MQSASLEFQPLNGSGPLPEPLNNLFSSDFTTYALLDGAQIEELPVLLESSGLEHECLFDGDALAEYGEMAPWLVKLSADNALTTKMFSKSKAPWHFWGKVRFTLLQSDRDLRQLKTHLKRFIRPETDGSRRLLFRFWDAQILQDYIEGTSDNPQRAGRLFSDGEAWVLSQICLCPSEAPSVALYRPEGTPPPLMPFRLDALDREALRDGVERRMVAHFAKQLAPKLDEILPGGSGFAKDYARGAYDLIRANTPRTMGVRADDIFQLALLGGLWGDQRGKILNGPLFSEKLIPISHRIALARESYFAALNDIMNQKET